MTQRFLAIALALGCLTPAIPARAQQPAAVQHHEASISGLVIDQQGGLPIVHADVTLLEGDRAIASTQTGGDGRFSFPSLPPAVYTVRVAARAYQITQSTDLYVADGGETVRSDFALVRESSSSDMKTIGRTSTAAVGRSLQSSTTITRPVDPQVLQNQGYWRLGEGLGLLPGVNLRGQGANTGDDLYVDIRGLKPSETQTLLDGHPIGPIGVNSQSTSGGYDYAASPLVGLRNVQVTYGAGALGLYGTDAAGGTVDWQTLDPSTAPSFSFSQGIGSLDKLSTSVTGSGTFGKLGFVVAHGVTGNDGLFPGGPQLQSGLLGTNLTSANIAKYTYPVSGDMLLRSDMAKLRFDLSAVTQLTLTAFDTNSWEDKTGTGNNFTPFDVQYYNTVPKGIATSGPCKGKVQVTTDAGKTCLDPVTFAQETSGPAGTGAGRTVMVNDQDYHARLTTQALKGYVTFDAFENGYRYNGSTPISQTTSVPTYFVDHFQTFGFLASYDYASPHNDIGVGWYVQHQRYDGVRNNYQNPQLAANTPVTTIATGNAFIRDVWSPSRYVQLFVNAWAKQSTSSETNANSLDPRLSLVLRPTSNDVVRFTGGKSVGLPDPTQAIGTGFTNAGSLNPQCASLKPGVGGISVGTPGINGLEPETSTDYEFAYGHRFADGTLLQGDYYNSSVKNMLFPTTINATLLPAGTIPPAVLAAIYNRVSSYSAACQSLLTADPSSLIPYLALTVPTNAANGLFRGIEMSVRHPITRELSFEATWDVQSSVALNIPTLLLKQNVFLVNGAQLFGIPLQKQNVAFDYAGRTGFAAHIDATRFGQYNQFDAQPFIVTNAFVSQRLRKGTNLTFGGVNILGARNGTYAETGIGLFVPENQYGTDTTPFSQSASYNKLRSYTPPQYTLTLSQSF
ncbi:MAG TPA: TonB-dependent receptor [Candidatus Acidoferrum sp.]|nr:TonB-dependent receptor [Candidatus Acidoferrum sp.]